MRNIKEKLFFGSSLFLVLVFLLTVLLGLDSSFRHEIIKSVTGMLGILMLVFVILLCLKLRIEGNKYRLGNAEYPKSRMDLEQKIRELQRIINYTEEGWRDNNHLILEGQRYNYHKIHSIELSVAQQFGIIEPLDVQEKKAFMLMPFNHEAAQIFVQCRKSLEVFGIELKKSDDEFIQGDLLKNIVRQIITSNIIIANLDGKNPNVLYELGISHTLGKKTILIAMSKEIPFAVQGNYIIFYRTLDELDRKIQDTVKQILTEQE